MMWVRLGSALMFVAVAAGAFCAHALKNRLDARALEIWETAARYQVYHALALFLVAWLETRTPVKTVAAAGWCFFAGTMLFSGSLYALALTGIRSLGAITPIGGALFLAGWLALAAGPLPRNTASRLFGF
jgi:uncharacterized membrane protein YgdD (TMEM256/DUF423 family)